MNRPQAPADAGLELWAGAECTVNRIGDAWRDQLELTGFARRPEDLDRLAMLGARRLRFPVLWERVAPNHPGEFDWRWSDAAMKRLDALALPAIVGLLHHGSGPRYTSLVDPDFPRLFADYARRVAERYPEQRYWTPINEPLTTARFSALYGLWYPHLANDRSFVRALLQQVRGTVLAMAAIREVNPAAELIQTDDLGFTRCVPSLAEQARFDNTRRWLGFDLLTGRVDRHHPLWGYLVESGATPRELAALCDAPCPPDVVGINTYATSERFLDDRLHLYPGDMHGGNGRERYVDVETVRADGALIDGFGGRLREAWDRYALPLAITEVHMGCTREEQMRWLQQAWDAARQAREEGIDVRAVTVWAAFGTVDWNSLLTRAERNYEPGLWDARSDPPRLTALGQLARQLGRAPSQDAEAPHPVLAGTGWWQRDLRLRVPAHGVVTALPARGAKLLIAGGAGRLARAFARLCHMRGLPYELLTRAEMDIADPKSVAAALDAHTPWAVVNAAGYTQVDRAESDPRQWRENATGPAVLAESCERRGIRLLSFSSDMVFSGDRGVPYLESDVPGPLNAYGLAQAHAERAVSHRAPWSLVIRSAAFFGPWDDLNFVTQGLAALQRGERWRAACDQVVSPTYLPDLVQASLDLLIDGEHGIWHLTNGDALSWVELACRACEHAGLDRRLVDPSPGIRLGQLARRPDYGALHSERGAILPALDDALSRYLKDRQLVPSPPPTLRAAVEHA
jgi:dTDP-4-dehydrorhamnose reductase